MGKERLGNQSHSLEIVDFSFSRHSSSLVDLSARQKEGTDRSSLCERLTGVNRTFPALQYDLTTRNRVHARRDFLPYSSFHDTIFEIE
jgi:hypothetical protein